MLHDLLKRRGENKVTKFNMGCGLNKFDGYINVDKFKECSPDLLMDLEVSPWEIESNTADEVVFNHCLEHIGQTSEVFLGVMKELYRICKPDAKVMINVPHPRHDFFIGDPTHVRVIEPGVLSLFSKKNNLHWKEIGVANSPLGLYLDVDFEIISMTQTIENYYLEKLQNGELTTEQMERIVRERNNVIQEYRFVLQVIKQSKFAIF